MKFETRSMFGLEAREIDIKPEDVKRVKEHPSCYKLSIIEKKDGSCITVQCRPFYAEQKLGLSIF